MTLGEMQAYSQRYNSEGIVVRQLRDGTFYLTDQWMQIIKISVPLADLANEISHAIATWDFSMPKSRQPPAKPTSNLTIEDLLG